MPVVAVVSRKGGVGKTALAVNLAACLAERGERVLLVDLDPQAAATLHVGHDYLAGPTLDDVLADGTPLPRILVETEFGITLAPAHPNMARTENVLLGEPGRELRLRSALAPVASEFGWIVADTGPNLGTLSLNALVAADFAILPALAEFPSVEASAHTLATIHKAAEVGLTSLRVLGIALQRVDSRTAVTGEVAEELAAIGAPILEATVRKAVAVTKAYRYRQPVTVFEPRSTVADDYRRLTEEVVRRAHEAH